uniref:Uncharacterized protein n=1 Tax=Rothia amarae TaxID=169480 RepID=A0A7H2BJ04_9MICC
MHRLSVSLAYDSSRKTIIYTREVSSLRAKLPGARVPVVALGGGCAIVVYINRSVDAAARARRVGRQPHDAAGSLNSQKCTYLNALSLI